MTLPPYSLQTSCRNPGAFTAAVEDDGVTMAILGRSLYEGTLDFTQALDLVEATEAAKDNQANNEG